MSRKILITGGLGTLGRGIAEALTARNFEVYTVDISHSSHEIGFSLQSDVPAPRYARCDVGEYRQLERVFETWGPFDLVYHCAAEFGRWNGEDFYEQIWRTNAVGTKNMLRLQEKHRFKLVHFSSSEVYGDWPKIMTENVTDQYAIKQMNDYAMTKWVNEMQIHNSALQFGTESVIVRIFNTYGPGEYYSPYRSVNCRFIYCALKGLPWTVFRGYSRTSTYLADSVNTLCNLTDRFKAGETYNIGGAESHTIEELSDLILKKTNADPKLVTYRDSEVLTTKHKKIDTAKAVKDLNHKTTVTLETGIEKTVQWMRSVYQF